MNMRLSRVVALLALVSGMAQAVDIEGALSGYLAAGTYDVVDDIHVPAGQTLTLAPGVTFLFHDDFWEEYEFDVYGTLTAVGSASQPVTFKPAPGVPEFNYLCIHSSSTHMSHCLVENVGSESATSDGGLWIDGCSPLVENTTVASANWHAVRVTGPGARPTISRCTITGASGDGIDCDGGAGLNAVNCVITGNGGDGICLSSGINTVTGCLLAGNGEDGIDCHGLSDYDAVILNCTMGQHPSEALSDCSEFDLVNCLVADDGYGLDLGSGTTHTYVVDDLSFFGFANPSAGNYRLTQSSPGRGAGTRFGAAAGLLPSTDIDGNPRINGIVDMGAYESTLAQDPGTSGTYFSRNLLCPRMTWPALALQGSTVEAWIALLGTWSSGSVSASITNPLGQSFPLSVQSVTGTDVTPSSTLDVQLYGVGVERVQRVVLQVPAGTPADFYDIQISMGGNQYHSQNAVRVFEGVPAQWGFIHITDTHVGFDEEEYSSAERLGFFVPEANFLDPAFVLVTGDCCENQNLSNAYADTLLKRISSLRVPVFLIPGNHDHYNHSQENNEFGYYRYFQSVNRFENAELAFGGTRLYCLNSGPDAELIELYRCRGPETAALDWVESRLAASPGTGPRIMAFHGPNYDYFSWNLNNVSRVRDIMNSAGFALGLAGHTHRFETFLNSGDNYLGRNDFSHDDDWGRDVPFPGFPLHVQTSSLGKEEHISWPSLVNAAPPSPEMTALMEQSREGGRGIFGDSIAWRYVRISGSSVSFFTSDTDGDGYRNTENAWILGELQFDVQSLPGGVIQSTVTNDHYETWYDVRHYIPAVPGQSYAVTGGTLVRQHPDGVVEVSVPSMASMGSSVVVLTPLGAGVGGGDAGWAILGATPNPFGELLSLTISAPAGAGPVEARIFDATGRIVRDIDPFIPPAGTSCVEWAGDDEDGKPVAAGVYFVRVSSGAFSAVARVVRIP